MKASKIREKTVEEIQLELKESRQKLFQMKFENNSGKLKNPLRIGQLRRDVARMMTVLNEKRMEK